jgi:O-antigen/teichoic acid export membrane protein
MMIGVSWWLWRQLRTQGPPPAPDDVQTMVGYGRHMTAISGLSVVQAQFDSLLVSAFLPLTVMADYAIATVVSNQFKTLWNVYLSVRYPIFVRMETNRRRRQMLWEGGLVWVGFIGAGLLLWLTAYWLIPLLLPPSYMSSLPYIGWLILAFLTLLPGAFVEVYFRTEQDQRQQYVLRGVAAVAGLLLPAAFLPIWNITGIVIGRVLAGAIFSIFGLWSFRRNRSAPTIQSTDTSL